MKYFSTAGDPKPYSFKEGVIKGLAPDNGLYFPERIPKLSQAFLDNLTEKTSVEIGIEMMRPFVSEDLNEGQLAEIVAETISFDFPVKHIKDNIYTLELYHGPTLAFKDVGARFMSRCLRQFKSTDDIIVLVATSGDTGSAVANGFLNVPGVKVVVLYPAGKVSELQEKQFATLGENITAIKIEGKFDDCQSLVKQAFLDKELNQKLTLSSANSINLARWLPQSIYYGIMAAKVKKENPAAEIVVSVPSGNFGNITAGLLAQRMGIPITRFIAATNANDVVPEYLKSGYYIPRPSVETLANAMDVGDPSNFVRLRSLFHNDDSSVQLSLSGQGYNDDEISNCLAKVKKERGYLLDPHGATGYLSLEDHLKDHETGIFLETAHPAKFKGTVEKAIGEPIYVPERLQAFANRKLLSFELPNDFTAFKNYLLDNQ